MFGFLFSVLKVKCPLYPIGNLFKKRNILIGNVLYVQLLPLQLEDQWLVEHGPYTDVDSELWIKCNKCYNGCHVKCLPSVPPVGNSFTLLFAVLNKHISVIFSLVLVSFGFIAMDRTLKCKPPSKEKCRSTPKCPRQE